MKKFKMKIIYIFLICSFVLCSCGESENIEPLQNVNTEKSETVDTSKLSTELSSSAVNEKIGEKLPVSRGLAAKMITLAFSDRSEIEGLDTEINFTDVMEDEWYFDYINAAYSKGYMKGSGDKFLPLEPLSLNEAQVLLNKINPSNKTKIKITDETKNKPVSYSLWMELYQKALVETCEGKTLGEVCGIYEKEVIVFATTSNSNMEPWTMATDLGIYKYSGYSMDAYADEKVKFLVKGNEILGVISVTDKSPIITNAYIKDFDGENLTVFMGGGEREYKYSGEAVKGIGDLKISNGKAIGINYVNDMITGVIKKVDNKCIELQEQGVLNFVDGFKVYSENGDIIGWGGIGDLICGSSIADYYVREGKVSAAVIRREGKPEFIRAVISKTGFQGYVHDNVSITGTGSFTVVSGENEKKYNKGDEVAFNNETLTQGRAYVKCDKSDDKIKLISITRSGNENPEYYGTMEIEKREDGFVIINEVELEKYLYSVVPSEMPSSYGIEASKVQAVTARSYAYNQYYGNKYHDYGGNVDDSTMSQVYNNTGENEISVNAVNDTKGLCMTFEGEVISANFFSTSCGVTANSGEVWADTGAKKFPTQTRDYLKASKQYKNNDYGALFIEENADRFFKETNIESFDKGSGWFRWNVKMNVDELSAVINDNLKTAYERNNFLIKTLQSDGSYLSKPIESIGTLKDLIVKKRGEGGNIMELLIKGSSAEVLVMTEYNIRSIIKPTQLISGGLPIVINCHNGTIMKNYSLLPSAFFTMDKNRDSNGNLINVVFYGGGNGHGVGMSQNGVKGMIEQGYKFEEILKHYFQGIEVVNKI